LHRACRPACSATLHWLRLSPGRAVLRTRGCGLPDGRRHRRAHRVAAAGDFDGARDGAHRIAALRFSRVAEDAMTTPTAREVVLRAAGEAIALRLPLRALVVAAALVVGLCGTFLVSVLTGSYGIEWAEVFATLG